jgi:plastocyanin
MRKITFAGGLIVIIALGAAFLYRNKDAAYPPTDRPAEDEDTRRAPTAEPSPTPEISVSASPESAHAPTAEPTVSPTPSPSPARTPEALELEEITITGHSFSFTPSRITVHKGDNVRITFKNAGGFHDLVVDELGLRTKQINAGEEDSIEFTADKTGLFAYYCSVNNHRAMGMEGTLIVE